MRAELSSIKLGDRVVYTVGGVEYNALALGAASEGWGQSIKLTSIFLSLTYLNKFGVQVKIIAAPLLGIAADEEHLKDIAQQAAQKTFGYVTAHDDVKAQMVAEQLANVKANPRTNGWRPYVEGEEVTTLRAALNDKNDQLALLDAKIAELTAPADPAIEKQSEQERFLALLADPIVVAFFNDPANQAAIHAAMLEGKTSLAAATKASDTGLPSAEDLDAVEAEKALKGSVIQDGDLFKPADPTSYTDVVAAAIAAANQAGSLADATEDSKDPEPEHATEESADETSAPTEAPATTDAPASQEGGPSIEGA
jgi:hypothetical protein